MNTPLRRSGMARVLKESHSFTCTPRVHPLTEWTIPAFAFPAEAGTHLLTPEGWKAELALGDDNDDEHDHHQHHHHHHYDYEKLHDGLTKVNTKIPQRRRTKQLNATTTNTSRTLSSLTQQLQSSLQSPVTTKMTHLHWRRYTMARQVKWPGWKIHRPGSRPGFALPSSPVYCFASVIVWTENKNVTISDRFICFILTVKRSWRPVFSGWQLRKRR